MKKVVFTKQEACIYYFSWCYLFSDCYTKAQSYRKITGLLVPTLSTFNVLWKFENDLQKIPFPAYLGR